MSNELRSTWTYLINMLTYYNLATPQTLFTCTF